MRLEAPLKKLLKSQKTSPAGFIPAGLFSTIAFAPKSHSLTLI